MLMFKKKALNQNMAKGFAFVPGAGVESTCRLHYDQARQTGLPVALV